MTKFSVLWAGVAALVLLGVSAAWADLGPGGGPVVPDPVRPGVGIFPNVKTIPLKTSDSFTVPWQLHLTTPQANLAGVRFKVHYDANEVDLIHVMPTIPPAIPFQTVTPGGGTGHGGYSVPMPPLPSSLMVSSPPLYDATNSTRTFTGWLPPTIANLTGTAVLPSQNVTFASFVLHARHTSLFNSDFDFRVSQATTIEHCVNTTLGIWTKWVPSVGWVPTTRVLPSEFYLGLPVGGVHAWLGVEHAGDSVGPGGGDVIPDPERPGEGFFPNVKTLPLTTSDTITVPWAVHKAVLTNNVAGYRFKVHYDRNEVDLLHVLPAGSPPFGPITPGGVSHGGFSVSQTTLPESELVVDPPLPDTVNATATFTGWLPPSLAMASGTEVPSSVQQTFASFVLHARHTSLFNTDFDLRVSQITSILHATTPLLGSFSVWQPSVGFLPASVVNPSEFYLGSPITGEHAWLGIEHAEWTGAPSITLGGMAILAGILMLVPFWVVQRRSVRGA